MLEAADDKASSPKATAPIRAALCASAMPRGGVKGLAARSHSFTFWFIIAPRLLGLTS
ncbi:hypothetical protein D3C87_1694130 [compost metagenome]